MTDVVLACFFNLQAQDCESALEDVEEAWDQRQYSDIIARLQECPSQGLPQKQQRIAAYEYLARAHWAGGHKALADSAIYRLLDDDSKYTPKTPAYTRSYVALAEEVKERWLNDRKDGGWPWLWIGVGGGVITGDIVYFILNNNDDPFDPLPEAPDPPTLKQ